MKTETEKPTRLEFETFREPGRFVAEHLKQESPSCFNGTVAVRRWRVTIELVDEPSEVIVERIRKLRSETKNIHHFTPLRNEAAKYGADL